jgi:hypothetical protein
VSETKNKKEEGKHNRKRGREQLRKTHKEKRKKLFLLSLFQERKGRLSFFYLIAIQAHLA